MAKSSAGGTIFIENDISKTQSVKDLSKWLSADQIVLTPYQNSQSEKTPVMEEIKRKAEDLKNTALAQDIKLKKNTLQVLFIFLALETITIFVYAFLQATNTFNFRLEEWSFKLLVAATITQITYMLQVAVKHLFPGK
jgi:hypothetical protein